VNDYCEQIAPVLELYGSVTGLGDPQLDDAIVSDLITDLHHWCDYLGWDFDSLLQRSSSHYQAES
jgi:hypothetical protein